MQRTPPRFILPSRKRVKNKIGLANFTFGENKLAKQKLTLANTYISTNFREFPSKQRQVFV